MIQIKITPVNVLELFKKPGVDNILNNQLLRNIPKPFIQSFFLIFSLLRESYNIN